MPTSFTDQFFTFDPADPPAVGTPVDFEKFTLIDQNDDGDIDEFDDDAVAGLDVTATWPGDTVTINVPGVGDVTYVGTTIYVADGSVIFTPTDGQVLSSGSFVSSTYVTTQGPLLTGKLGPSCFVKGTLIATPEGQKRVEDLSVGNLICTLDRGATPLLYVRHRAYGLAYFHKNPRHGPVRISQSAFSYANNCGPLIVSPQHRLVVRSRIVERMFGVEEVLVPAAQLVGSFGIERQPLQSSVDYYHLLFDHHAIVFANGIEAESLLLGKSARSEFVRHELIPLRHVLAAEPVHNMSVARKIVRGKRLRQLLHRHKKNSKRLCFPSESQDLGRFLNSRHP